MESLPPHGKGATRCSSGKKTERREEGRAEKNEKSQKKGKETA
jgi:hypothetical protein